MKLGNLIYKNKSLYAYKSECDNMDSCIECERRGGTFPCDLLSRDMLDLDVDLPPMIIKSADVILDEYK